MSDEAHGTGPLDVTFSEPLCKSTDSPNAWTCVKWAESVDYFGTKGLVKVRGTIDGVPFTTSFMALGNGTHMLPVAAAVRKKLGKGEGDTVEVALKERLS
ncbi:DUF1905 domain-containing protein [Nocardioides sp. WS12]|uniref:DUF1905 domain-containing protein n=1 Tax=Nocardioides sp. WS12 TaxID=2486272 RepID=UPI0015FD830A|nr:DUF1905 domain-containing protein [Nocardioides sp. WS12]